MFIFINKQYWLDSNQQLRLCKPMPFQRPQHFVLLSLSYRIHLSTSICLFENVYNRGAFLVIFTPFLHKKKTDFFTNQSFLYSFTVSNYMVDAIICILPCSSTVPNPFGRIKWSPFFTGCPLTMPSPSVTVILKNGLSCSKLMFPDTSSLYT